MTRLQSLSISALIFGFLSLLSWVQLWSPHVTGDFMGGVAGILLISAGSSVLCDSPTPFPSTLICASICASFAAGIYIFAICVTLILSVLYWGSNAEEYAWLNAVLVLALIFDTLGVFVSFAFVREARLTYAAILRQSDPHTVEVVTQAPPTPRPPKSRRDILNGQ